MNLLFDQMGHMGPNCYWNLLEVCAEKMQKSDSDRYTEAHCKFRFHERVLRQELRISRKNLQKFLRICSELSQIFSSFSGEIVEIDFPKILECLDRDSKRARAGSADTEPRRKKKEVRSTDAAFLNWREAATKVLWAIKRYGNWSDSESEVRADIGDTVFEICQRVGVHRIRTLPGDKWAVKDLSGMLEEAHQQLQFKFDPQLVARVDLQLKELS